MARWQRSASKEEFWRLMVAEQERCGLSIRAFCRKKSISEPSFYVWRKELQRRDAARSAGDGSDARLIPVDVVRPTREARATEIREEQRNLLEIATPGGFTLRFGQGTTPEIIARLLDVIGQRVPGGTASC